MIDRLLEEDRGVPKKQRHTARRIYDRLTAEYGLPCGYTMVKDYVQERGQRMREMYVPLSHSPGHAQCDFGQAKAVIGELERKMRALDQAATLAGWEFPEEFECTTSTKMRPFGEEKKPIE